MKCLRRLAGCFAAVVKHMHNPLCYCSWLLTSVCVCVYLCVRFSQEQENSVPGAPESLTFKERQRLFSQGKEVSNKVKASRKLMELENELNTK